MLLMIGQDDGAKGSDRVKGLGFRLYMTTDQDGDALPAAIESRGGTLESAPEDMPWGARALPLLDPDDFAITIASKNQPTARPTSAGLSRQSSSRRSNRRPWPAPYHLRADRSS